MPQKNELPNKEQAKWLKANGLIPIYDWAIIKELHNHMIVRNKYTNEVKMIDKK